MSLGQISWQKRCNTGHTTKDFKQAHLEAAEAHGQVVQPPYKDKFVLHACGKQAISTLHHSRCIDIDEAAQTCS